LHPFPRGNVKGERRLTQRRFQAECSRSRRLEHFVSHQDPRFTAMRVGLGKALIKLGRVTEAQRELQTVLDEKAPSDPADWAMRDTREARELLDALKSES
jgi:hypothetical protein